MAHLAEKQALMDIIRGKEKMYSRSQYVMYQEQYVKATSLEEAKRKFQDNHKDVISPGEVTDCDVDGEVWEMEETPVEDYYS